MNKIPYNKRRQIEKKILPEYFTEVVSHRKNFELRKDEDDIQVGDILILNEWDGEKYTGRSVRREVSYVLRDAECFGLVQGYCILGIKVVGWDIGRAFATLD